MYSAKVLATILYFSTLAPQAFTAPAPLPIPQDLFADIEKQFQQLAASGGTTSSSSSSSGDQTFSQVSDGKNTVTNSRPGHSSASLPKRDLFDDIRQELEQLQAGQAGNGRTSASATGDQTFTSVSNGGQTVTDSGPGSSSASLRRRFAKRDIQAEIQATIARIRKEIEDQKKSILSGLPQSAGGNSGISSTGNLGSTGGNAGLTGNSAVSNNGTTPALKGGSNTFASASNGTNTITQSGIGNSDASVGQDSAAQGVNGSNDGNGADGSDGADGADGADGNDGTSSSSSASGNGQNSASASNGQETVTSSGTGDQSASVGKKML